MLWVTPRFWCHKKRPGNTEALRYSRFLTSTNTRILRTVGTYFVHGLLTFPFLCPALFSLCVHLPNSSFLSLSVARLRTAYFELIKPNKTEEGAAAPKKKAAPKSEKAESEASSSTPPSPASSSSAPPPTDSPAAPESPAATAASPAFSLTSSFGDYLGDGEEDDASLYCG